MEEKITTETIRKVITGWIQEKKDISPLVWLNAAQKLSVLESDDHNELVELEYQYNELVNKYAEEQNAEKPNMTQAERKAKRSEVYKAYRKKELLIKAIDKDIALASKLASITSYAH